ncbi:MAG: polysaccharide biosynthesis/export family protein, partial [Verrucomicrobiota bacterium]
LVQSQRLELAALEKQATAPISLTNLTAETKLTGNTFANTLALQILELQTQKQALAKKIDQLQKLRETVQAKINGLSEKGMRYALIKSRADSLENLHSLLSNRQREAQLFEDNALGYFKIFTRATPGSISLKHRWIKLAAITAAGCLLGLFLTLLAVLIAEITDTKLKTAADLERVTRLPVLATLGDLKQMDPSSQVSWAFRTLTLLKGKLSRDNDQGLVCGFISAHHGEGRSTWINLLVSAASQRGLRVLTVATRPSAPEADMESEEEEPVNGASAEIASQLPAPRNGALTPNFLACPGEVTEQLKDPNSQPVVHIPLPGWVWNLERRKQWQSALAHWRQIDNLVLLVELPPASQPESILLAENVPQLIWLTSSGMADAGETNTHLETLRHARCNLVGAVLNREPASFWKTHVSRWLRQAAAVPLLVSFLTVGILAQEKSETATQQNQEQLTVAQTSPDTPLVFSGANAPKRAAWQQRLTVGPGDALDFSLFGYPELTRTNLFIGPDGRITYLQAQDVPAVGLTIDELRARFDEELSKYYRAPKTIITPVAFHSKKYFVLGKVNLKGAFVLDRPITVLEAVARAKGLETGLFERSSVELADLSRSFLIRNGQRIPLNFERLFFEGDLSQNTMLEPGDYLYFPSTSLNEIYVLGEVMSPGILGFTPQSTLIAAISIRGGFTPKAYKKKILVVRGSLNQPEAHIVDAGAILEARQPDFKLQQKDIVYISKRPWAKVEELLDEAGQAFLEAMVAAWTGLNVGPIITRPITPQL